MVFVWNKKTIIQASFIVLLLGGSGIVLYNGFKTKNVAPPVLSIIQQSPVLNTGTKLSGLDVNNIDKTLPYASDQAFTKALKDILGQQALNFGTIQYPKLDPSFDVGVNLPDLIKSDTSKAQ